MHVYSDSTGFIVKSSLVLLFFILVFMFVVTSTISIAKRLNSYNQETFYTSTGSEPYQGRVLRHYPVATSCKF